MKPLIMFYKLSTLAVSFARRSNERPTCVSGASSTPKTPNTSVRIMRPTLPILRTQKRPASGQGFGIPEIANAPKPEVAPVITKRKSSMVGLGVSKITFGRGRLLAITLYTPGLSAIRENLRFVNTAEPQTKAVITGLTSITNTAANSKTLSVFVSLATRNTITAMACQPSAAGEKESLSNLYIIG